jgi:hypothetical protein
LRWSRCISLNELKTIVFIFAPVVIERTEIHIAVQSEQRAANNEATRDEVYPFWTWFIDNPRPQSPK